MSKTVEALIALDRETKAEVFITGGFVRDFIRKKRNNDLDIVVRKLSLQAIKTFLSKYGKVSEVSISNTHDKFALPILVFKTEGDPIEAQITLPRRGKKQYLSVNNTLHQDCKHRDFTINAMYMPIRVTRRDDIIDLVGGIESIRKREIKAVGNPEDRLKESPIRIMRAFTLSSRMNYQIDSVLIDAIRHNRDLVALAPAEAVQAELNEILLSKRPSKYLKLMNKLGILSIVMPELYKCVGVKQDRRYHKYDVFTHCIYTCDHIEPDLVLRLAALLHDIGKPDTYAEVPVKGEPPRITFHKHEIYSVKNAVELLRRLRYSNGIIKKTIALIKHHMYHYASDVYSCTQNNCSWTRSANQLKEKPKHCPACGAPVEFHPGWTDAAVRRFIAKIGIDETNVDDLPNLPLFKLRAAERLGNGLKKNPITEKQRDFEARIVSVFKESKGLTIADLNIDGNVIMEMFRMKPGQKVGEILKYLLECVLENPKANERVELLKLATEFLYRQEEKDWTRKPE
jgi:putative nucleotidyltransferase with HDIG domain